MRYVIKKINHKNVSTLYLETINNSYTKKFIKFSKIGKLKKNKKDLIRYIKALSKNESLFGIFKDKKHIANFKITKKHNRIGIGFLVFLGFQGRGIIEKVFPTILKLRIIKLSKFKKLYLGVGKKNTRAIKLYRKLGFKYQKNSTSLMYLNLY